MRRYIKSLVGGALLRSGLYARLLGEDGFIVAFHRIDDRYPEDPITTTVARFKAFCRFFRDHFDVVPLPRFLDDLSASRPLAGKLAITFDDGYRDNHRLAAPVLDELGLPATFFVTTGFIGTERVPWWDEQQGIRSEWMSWDQVGELAQGGFGIGAHTVNHIDFGLVSSEEARGELARSRARLEELTGSPVDLFAYPYGREDQLSEENRALVREMGFRCALSCHGGRVRSGDDPHRLHRIPISPWHRDEKQLATELLRPPGSSG